jgi:uncharacterized phage infection (PIP) family protein YhgE
MRTHPDQSAFPETACLNQTIDQQTVESLLKWKQIYLDQLQGKLTPEDRELTTQYLQATEEKLTEYAQRDLPQGKATVRVKARQQGETASLLEELTEENRGLKDQLASLSKITAREKANLEKAIEARDSAIGKAVAVLLRPAANRRLMQIAEPARQCLNLLKPFTKLQP